MGWLGAWGVVWVGLRFRVGLGLVGVWFGVGLGFPLYDHIGCVSKSPQWI